MEVNEAEIDNTRAEHDADHDIQVLNLWTDDERPEEQVDSEQKEHYRNPQRCFVGSGAVLHAVVAEDEETDEGQHVVSVADEAQVVDELTHVRRDQVDHGEHQQPGQGTHRGQEVSLDVAQHTGQVSVTRGREVESEVREDES